MNRWRLNSEAILVDHLQPFDGQYRNACVVHDFGCEEQSESWEDVHRMFHDACRCCGVSSQKAKLLYFSAEEPIPIVDHHEHAQLATLLRPVFDEVVDPDVVRPAGTLLHAAVLAPPARGRTPPFALLPRHGHPSLTCIRNLFIEQL